MLADPLNASDVASILHIGRNAVYDLAKSGALPSYKAGRKILFSLKDVERYLEGTRSGATPPSIDNDDPKKDSILIGGLGIAADLFVDRLQASGRNAHREPLDSYDALSSLYKGAIDAALIHLYDQRTNSYNVPYVQRLAPGTPVVVFRLFRRWTGFSVQKGNPRSISTWGGLLKAGIRLANRRKGCGARVLLDEKLISMEASPWSINGYDNEYDTGMAAAHAVAAGVADVAIIDEETAAQMDDIDFVKLQQEWVDLVVLKDRDDRYLARTMRSLFADAAFKREFSRIVLGDTENLGSIIYEC